MKSTTQSGKSQKCQSRVSQLISNWAPSKQRSETLQMEATCSVFIVPWFHVCPCKNAIYMSIPPILSDPLHFLWTANVLQYHRECSYGTKITHSIMCSSTHHAMSKLLTNGLQHSMYLLQMNIFNHSLFLTWYTSLCLNPWKWRKNGPPKCCKPPTRLQYHNRGAKNLRIWVSTSAFTLHGFYFIISILVCFQLKLVPYTYHTVCQFTKLLYIIWKLLAIHVHYSKEFWLRLHFYMRIIIFCETYIKRNMCLLDKQEYEITEAVSNTKYMKDTTD